MSGYTWKFGNSSLALPRKDGEIQKYLSWVLRPYLLSFHPVVEHALHNPTELPSGLLCNETPDMPSPKVGPMAMECTKTAHITDRMASASSTMREDGIFHRETVAGRFKPSTHRGQGAPACLSATNSVLRTAASVQGNRYA